MDLIFQGIKVKYNFLFSFSTENNISDISIIQDIPRHYIPVREKILLFLVCIGLSPDAGRDFALLKGSPESCKIQKDFSWLWSKVHFTLTGLLQGVLKLYPLFLKLQIIREE